VDDQFHPRSPVSGLTPGVSYNLYEYEFSSVSGTGSGAALAVPTENFNANSGMATSKITFTATSSNYTQTVTTTSNEIVVFRAVPTSASATNHVGTAASAVQPERSDARLEGHCCL
jgi:hypothetical protein